MEIFWLDRFVVLPCDCFDVDLSQNAVHTQRSAAAKTKGLLAAAIRPAITSMSGSISASLVLHFFCLFRSDTSGIDTGASWPGGRGPWPTLEFRSSDFSEILRFRRKITDFGLALCTFDQFRFFASLSVLPTTAALFVAIS